MFVNIPFGLYAAFRGYKDAQKPEKPFIPGLVTTSLGASLLGAGLVGLYTGGQVYKMLKGSLPLKEQLLLSGLTGVATAAYTIPTLLGVNALSYGLGYGTNKLLSKYKESKNA